MNEKIWLSSPHMGEDEIKFIHEAFETNWVAPVGPHINGFETDLANWANMKYCAALSSGTAAIHLALIILGIEQGDEVICSSFTFSGSCNPIAYQRATPVFVDSEDKTWNMDPVLLEEAINDRIKKTGKAPKAIIVVDLYGMPAQLDQIVAIAGKYGIPVVEDAAEALGSTLHNKPCGAFGSIGIYSFNGNKIITTSGGGALLSNDESVVKKARFLATQARDEAPHYEHSTIGYNYRLSNISAGIGRGQMAVLKKRIEQRRANFDLYKRELDPAVFSFLPEPPNFFSNRWLTTTLINKSSGRTPESLRLKLEKKNIETRPLWKPMHLQPVFKGSPAYTNGVSDDLFRRGLCLPSGSNLTMQNLEFVVKELSE